VGHRNARQQFLGAHERRSPAFPLTLTTGRVTTLPCARFGTVSRHPVGVMSFCRLVEEVFEIQETVDKLKAKLRESENALQHLLRTKSSLEHDLNVKNNSLFIDRERCMGLRKTFPLAPRVACY